MNLIRIAARVAAVPVESGVRHKSPYGVKSKFRWTEFKALGTAQDMHGYARIRLEALGRGSSRAVYVISSGKVLKIAASLHGKGADSAGVAQNRAEVDIFTDPRTKPVVAAVYDADPEYRWILSEAVRPHPTSSEFDRVMGSDLKSTVEAAQIVDVGDVTIQEMIESSMDYGVVLTREAVQMIVDLLALGLEVGDLYDPSHWGKTANGRLVLLDYGFTTGVYEEFYLENSGSGAGDSTYGVA